MTHPAQMALVCTVAVLLLRGSAVYALHADAMPVALQVDSRPDTEQYAEAVRQGLEEGIGRLPRYQVVGRKEARFLIRAELVSAAEVVVDNLPTADVGVTLMMYEMKDGTGIPEVGVLINNTVTRQLVGVELSRAVREVVSDITVRSLESFRYRFDFPPVKKSSSRGELPAPGGDHDAVRAEWCGQGGLS